MILQRGRKIEVPILFSRTSLNPMSNKPTTSWHQKTATITIWDEPEFSAWFLTLLLGNTGRQIQGKEDPDGGRRLRSEKTLKVFIGKKLDFTTVTSELEDFNTAPMGLRINLSAEKRITRATAEKLVSSGMCKVFQENPQNGRLERPYLFV